MGKLVIVQYMDKPLDFVKLLLLFLVYQFQTFLTTNAQSVGLRTLVAAESALQQPKQQMCNAVSKGPPLTYFRFAGDIYYVFIFSFLVESHLIRNKLWCDLA